MCYIDQKKTFDSVNRDKIWESLESKNVSKQQIEAIQSTYHNIERQEIKCEHVIGCRTHLERKECDREAYLATYYSYLLLMKL